MLEDHAIPKPVRIVASPGAATVTVDGRDVSADLAGYTVQHDIHTGLPAVILHARTPGGVQFEGLARVAVAAPHDPGRTVAEFLAGIDPVALERAALNRDDLGTERGAATAAILRQLADWATGPRQKGEARAGD